jgi:hypothetical protein
MIEAINHKVAEIKAEIEWLEFSTTWEDEVCSGLGGRSLLTRCRRIENQNDIARLNYLKLRLKNIKDTKK